jgi:hypothetical protein
MIDSCDCVRDRTGKAFDDCPNDICPLDRLHDLQERIRILYTRARECPSVWLELEEALKVALQDSECERRMRLLTAIPEKNSRDTMENTA